MAATLQDITALPLTSLRYGLADKLLRINTQQRLAPVAPMQVEALLEQLDEAEVNVNQFFNVKTKCEELLAAITEKKQVADRVYDLIISLKIIQADKNYPVTLSQYLDLLIREWQANIFPAEEMKHFLRDLQYVSKDRTLATEINNAQKAILEGEAPLDINLATPEKQLVWASHLLFLLYNPYMMYAWPVAKRKGAPVLTQTGLWKQVLSCHHVKYLRVLFGTHIFNLMRDSRIQLSWGPPGSWFFFNVNPAPGVINCDLLYSMLVGFDHARACATHEIGHAVQTKGIPDFIQELSDRMHQEKGDPTPLQQELELKQYFLNCAEDNAVNRFTQEIGRIFGVDYGYSLNYWYTAIGDVGRRYQRQEPIHLEDTPEERFKNLTFIISRVFLAHNGLFPATFEGWERIMARPEWITGRDRRNPEQQLDNADAYQQLMDMCEEVEHYFPPLQDLAGGPEHYGQLAEAYFKKRSELIHEIWKLHAEDWVRQIIEKEKEDLDDTKDRFNMEMNPSQPPPKPKDKKDEEEEDKDKEENKDKGDNPAPPTQSDKNSDKQSDEDLPGDPPDDAPPPDDSPGSDGEDGDDTSAGADGAAQDSPDDSGDAGDSEDNESGGDSEPETGTQPPSDPLEEKDKDKSQQEDKEEPGEPEGEDKAKQEQEQEGEPPEDAETKEVPQEEKPAEEQEQVDSPDQTETKESAPEEQETEGIDPAELEALMKKLMEQFKELVTMKEDEDAAPQAIEDDENPEAELIREVEEPEPAPQEQEEEREDKPGTERGDAQGGDEFSKGVLDSDYLPDDPLASIEDLMKALQESNEQDEARKQAKREDRGPLFQEEEKPKVKLEIPPAMNLDELANGNWDDFSKRVAMHGPVIAMMAAALSKLKRAQLKIIHKISKKHSIIPEGGDLRRFNEKAMQRLFQQLAKAEKFDKDDLALFRKDGKVAAESRPTRVILIDGSRSMSMGSHPLPMDKAIQEAVIDYMASSVAGYDTYISMFGPKNPIVLAEPGDPLFEIGKRIEKVHGGLNTMTFLAPALMQVVQRIAYRKKFKENYVGFTNFVIYSDGDIDDLKHSREIIHQIMQHAPKSTFDFVLITSKYATPMDVLIRTMDVRNPIHEIGVVRSTSQRHYPLALTSTYKLTQRLLNARSGFADPAFVRGAQFKRLLRLLTSEDGV
jgi:hypothetical protein